MVLFLLFIFFLFLENLLLPALMGPGVFPITLSFVSAMIIYGSDLRLRIFQAVVFLLLGEFFLGNSIGSLSLPFVVVALIFIWLNHFLGINSGLKEGSIFGGILGGMLVIAIFLLLYSFLFLFLEKEYSFILAWDGLKIFLKTSLLPMFGWALAFSILFRYGLIKSK